MAALSFALATSRPEAMRFRVIVAALLVADKTCNAFKALGFVFTELTIGFPYLFKRKAMSFWRLSQYAFCGGSIAALKLRAFCKEIN
jgi:hypothetical protein